MNKEQIPEIRANSLEGDPATKETTDWLTLFLKALKAEKQEDDSWILTYPNGSIKDFGNGMSVNGQVTDDMIHDIVQGIKAKGWKKINLHGDYDFQERLALEIKAQGLPIYTNFRPKNILDFEEKASYIRKQRTEGGQDNVRNERQGRDANGIHAAGMDADNLNMGEHSGIHSVPLRNDPALHGNGEKGERRDQMATDSIRSSGNPVSGVHDGRGMDRTENEPQTPFAGNDRPGLVHRPDVSPSLETARNGDTAQSVNYSTEQLRQQANELKESLTSSFKKLGPLAFVKMDDAGAKDVVAKLDRLQTVSFIATSSNNSVYSKSSWPAVDHIRAVARESGLTDALALMSEKYNPAMFQVPESAQHGFFLLSHGVIDDRETQAELQKILENPTEGEKAHRISKKQLKARLSDIKREKDEAGFFNFSIKKTLSKEIVDTSRELAELKKWEDDPKYKEAVNQERWVNIYKNMPVCTKNLEKLALPYHSNPRIALALHAKGPEFAVAVMGDIIEREKAVTIHHDAEVKEWVPDVLKTEIQAVQAVQAVKKPSAVVTPTPTPEAIQEPQKPAQEEFEEEKPDLDGEEFEVDDEPANFKPAPGPAYDPEPSF